MEKIKLYKIVITVLLVVNLVTLSFLWGGKSRHGRPMPHERDMTFLSKELGMTGANKEKLDAMETKHHTDKRALLEKNKVLREQLFGLLKTNASDTTTINTFVASIVTNQKKIELMTFYHFKEVRALCNAEQQEKLEETIAEAIRMAGGKPRKK